MFEFDTEEMASINEESILSSEKEYMPKLFSEENSLNENNISDSEPEHKLFEQDNNQEEDFEIPAFLRRQKS